MPAPAPWIFPVFRSQTSKKSLFSPSTVYRKNHWPALLNRQVFTFRDTSIAIGTRLPLARSTTAVGEARYRACESIPIGDTSNSPPIFPLRPSQSQGGRSVALPPRFFD